MDVQVISRIIKTDHCIAFVGIQFELCNFSCCGYPQKSTAHLLQYSWLCNWEFGCGGVHTLDVDVKLINSVINLKMYFSKLINLFVLIAT